MNLIFFNAMAQDISVKKLEEKYSKPVVTKSEKEWKEICTKFNRQH